MLTVKAMTITTDSLLPRPKLDYDGGYSVAVNGPIIVVGPANINSNMVEYVGCQGYHHLRLPHISVELCAISDNL
jgi:hypothetical protein